MSNFCYFFRKTYKNKGFSRFLRLLFFLKNKKLNHGALYNIIDMTSKGKISFLFLLSLLLLLLLLLLCYIVVQCRVAMQTRETLNGIFFFVFFF